MEQLELIRKKYEPVISLSIYGPKIRKFVENGLFFSGCYLLSPLGEVSKVLSTEENLPNFTSITTKDKTKINKARYRLYSLLLPIHDREVALQEFVDLSCSEDKD